jgi:phosphatidylserine decarboxylase
MNSGHANKAAIRLLLWSVAALLGFFAAAWIGYHLGGIILAFHKMFIVLWALFVVAVLYFFRDPDPIEPADINAIVSPAHGKVDVIDERVESEFMKGACRRISIGVSLLNVQVQYAPAAGTVAHLAHQAPAKRGETEQPESLLLGLDVVGRPDTKFVVQWFAGNWGKRIVPWVKLNGVVLRSARLGMMRPGRRVDLYLPGTIKLHVNPGDELIGGQTVVARFE